MSIINLAETAFNYRHDTNGIIDRKLLGEWMQKFVNGDKFLFEKGEETEEKAKTKTTEQNEEVNKEVADVKQQSWLIERKTKE